MKKLTQCILISFSMLISFNGVSQTVSGIISATDGEGLIGANVLVKGTSSGTITDISGAYSIEANEGDVLVFSFTGFATQEITVGTSSNIDVVLQAGSQLDEVVVTGYGTQKKANLTGAVGIVDAEILAARPLTSASQSLQGQVSGVWVNQNSGEPGQDGATIRIRGIGTLNNPDPLILVDGIEAPFDNIDPNDIESVTVLKDAASAAIYGARAANGVVLVTTKRGERNSKPTFNYTGFTGTSQVNSVPDYIWDSQEFMNLRNEADINSGRPPLYPADVINDYANGPNTNWFNEIFRNGAIQQHNLSISGGSETTNFNISLGYLDQESIVKNTDGSKRQHVSDLIFQHMIVRVDWQIEIEL